ncbi:MAG: 50S ribosomal protein L11 methyltransferase [Methylovirgula sp.]|uniref:50S ribosomal protein L11 methyltransferase n=1 Tax=Methylovirgula sp. TaxID=1978224 RepID=UPI00307681B9
MQTDERLLSFQERLFEKLDGKVHSGVFKGMRVIKDASWYGGQILQKLLGVYETELSGDIERMVYNNPEVVINIGCAEGYYAVGLAKRLSTAKIYAFDIEMEALRICERAAKINSVEDRFYFQTRATRSSLEPILSKNKKTAFIVDCEGCERQIFEALSNDLLSSSMILIECHDFVDPGVTEFLEQKLFATHLLHFVTSEDRDAREVELLEDCDEEIRWDALSEGRPEQMHWLLAYPRSSG